MTSRNLNTHIAGGIITSMWYNDLLPIIAGVHGIDYFNKPCPINYFEWVLYEFNIECKKKNINI